MSAIELLTYLSWIIYILIFFHVVGQAIHHPRRTHINIALFFTMPALIILINILAQLHILQAGPIPSALNGVFAISLAYLLLRLVDDFTDVPPFLLRGAAASSLLIGLGFFLYVPPRPLWFTILQEAYFIGFVLYSTVAFAREAERSTGVTERRLRAVAAGSLFLGLTLLAAGLVVLVPWGTTAWTMLTQVFSLASAVSYFLGFVAPAPLRRAWQEPELRAFLSRAATLPRLPTTEAIIEHLERGAASSTGAPYATIGLWDEASQCLLFPNAQEGWPRSYTLDVDLPAIRAFTTQKPLFSENLANHYPTYAEQLRSSHTNVLLAAPLTAGERRLGVLSVYAPHPSIFADDDLELVKLLADQASVVLESRALIDEAAHVQAREEAARLKEDFLSAAAHDLKTPLTTLVAQSQLLERRALRWPTEPADPQALQRLTREAMRLRDLVLELLDASRAEQGKLLGERERVDLMTIIRESCARHSTARHPCSVEGCEHCVGYYDRMRISQLVENLLENAVKYSPTGGEIQVRALYTPNEVYLTFIDHGIGIPPEEVPRLFDRFYRGSNVDDRRFAGMGLGLFMCQAIVEQHGGRIWATSQLGEGSTFHVVLPVTEGEAHAI